MGASRPAFTLIELIVAMVILAILSGVAVVAYRDYSSNARNSADDAALGGLRTALNNTYAQNRLNSAASSQWITALPQLPGVMITGQLPAGLSISGSYLVDQRGNQYTFTAETAASPAVLALGSGGSGGSGELPWHAVLFAAIPFALSRGRRRARGA